MNIIECRDRFWRWIAVCAPEVMEDLFNRWDRDTWSDEEWSNYWDPFRDPKRPAPKGHPAALAWCEQWSLTAEWCIKYATTTLSNWPKRSRRHAWKRVATGAMSKYVRPDPLVIHPWRGGELYKHPTKEELRKLVLDILDQAIDEYYETTIVNFPFPKFAKQKNRTDKTFDRHARWLIAYKLQDKKQREIAEAESRIGRTVTDEAISKAIGLLATQLDLENNFESQK